MAFLPPSGRRKSRLVRKSAPAPLEHDRSRLSRELEESRQKEAELKKKCEEVQRRVADLPRQIKERERKERELVYLRAVSTTTTADVFNKPRDKRVLLSRGKSGTRRMTRPEERSARFQFIILCVIFAAMFFLLCKSIQTLPH
jgi:septal ring factor EnvC (AmiA/AmiB activator)